ncbi:MAG: hypothetical protein K2X66_16880 [Cyanobacteria bacterium]|nr:hypothetical protein [Cyanobacteriota bacterium]
MIERANRLNGLNSSLNGRNGTSGQAGTAGFSRSNLSRNDAQGASFRQQQNDSFLDNGPDSPWGGGSRSQFQSGRGQSGRASYDDSFDSGFNNSSFGGYDSGSQNNYGSQGVGRHHHGRGGRCHKKDSSGDTSNDLSTSLRPLIDLLQQLITSLSNGGSTPYPTPTQSPTPSPSPYPTPTPSPSPTPAPGGSTDPLAYEGLAFDLSISPNLEQTAATGGVKDNTGKLIGDFNSDGIVNNQDSFVLRDAVNPGNDSNLTSSQVAGVQEDLRNVIRYNTGKTSDNAFKLASGQIIGDLNKDGKADDTDLAILNRSLAEPLNQQSDITKQIFG